jgi:hypothetical protein
VRLVVIVVVVGLVLAATPVRATDEKALHAYAGQIIVSPDPAPASLPELAAWAKANATKDRRYALIKGPPWDVHLAAVLPKDPGADKVTLVITEAAARKPASPIATLDVVARRRIVIAKTTATTAAGFEANKTYVLELVVKAKPVARAELELRN